MRTQQCGWCHREFRPKGLIERLTWRVLAPPPICKPGEGCMAKAAQ